MLGHEVTTSLAGRTSAPQLPAGTIRVGKFGGVPGLVGYLQARHFDRLVDATHPYARTMSVNAVSAAQQSGVPLVRFMRPAWPEPDGANWQHVANSAFAAAALPTGATALVTTGHDRLAEILERDDCDLVVRLIEPPDTPLPRHAKLILGHPPYSFAEELALMRREEVTHLLTKNSGGRQTEAKLTAARQLKIEIIMIDRPAYGPAVEAASVEETIGALQLG